MSLENIRRQFADPPNVHRFAPFWFLNHELEEAEMRWQVREMHSQGVGGFILHARHGLITPYMSQEWMDNLAAAIDEGKKLAMKAYLYDENNWPSGPADAMVFEGHSEYRMSGVVLSEEFEVARRARVRRRLKVEDELIAVIAVPVEDGEPVEFPESAVNLADFVEGTELDWRPPGGTWRVYVFSRRWFDGHFFGSYLDTLNPQAVRRFIELTHERYAERFGSEFGSTIQGIFTDEPSMNFNGSDALPWTGRLPGEFEWRKGYELLPALPALFREMGPATAKIRCDWYDVTTSLYTEAYFKQIYEFCDAHNLSLMGHVDCEGELVEHTRQQGDFFRGARWMHWGGVDFLCELTWPAEDSPWGLNNLAGPKFASSAAHLLGKRVVGCECFGLASQWAVDLRNLKWMTDWIVTLGVNLLEPHAFYYSIQGFRKWECPPGEFYQSAFWPYYRHLADYAGRLCSLFIDGQHRADVAFFYPIKSMWAELGPGPTAKAKELTESFNRLGRLLLKLNFDFDVVSEEMLQEAEFEDGTILIKHPDGSAAERFKILAMPAVTTISRQTARKLLEFVRCGGRIVAIGELPSKSPEQGEDCEVAEIFRQIFGPDYEAGFGVAEAARPVLSEKALAGWSGGILVGVPPAVDDEAVLPALAEVLEAAIEADVTVRAAGQPVPEVVHLHYVREGVHLFMFTNTSRQRKHEVEATMAVTGEVSIWNAQDGSVQPAPVARGETTRTVVPLSLEPTESVILAVDPSRECPSTPLIAADLPIVRVEGNKAVGLTAQAGTYSVTVGGRGEEGEVVRVRVARPPAPLVLEDRWQFTTDKPNCLPLTRWSYEMRNEVTGRDSDANRRVYTSCFDADIVPGQARLLLDGLAVEKVWKRSRPISYKVEVNGQRIEHFEPGTYLDHYIYEADLSGILREGRNEIVIETEGHLYEPGALQHPVVIVGRFAVAEEGQVPRLTAEPGEITAEGWEGQGYPYYSGVGIYSQTFRLTAARCACELWLEMERPRDLAEVLVNGKSCGVRCWEPFKWNIGSAAKTGINTIEIRVANSMQNLLVQQPRPSGIVGTVTIVPYRRVQFEW